MKKYRILKQGETILVGDERKLENGFEAVENEVIGMGVREFHERHGIFRREMPHSGKVQFLMHVSILATVTVDCDGKTQEEIEEEAGELAVEKILASPRDYVHFENVDFGGSRVDDDECQPAQG